MALEALPHTADELVDRLDEEFPARCIGPKQSEIDAHRYAAKRELIDWLIRLRADSEAEAHQKELGLV